MIKEKIRQHREEEVYGEEKNNCFDSCGGQT